MRFAGWVRFDRSILGDLYEGKLTMNEFAVWTILTLCADAKTGGYFINASALRTFTGNQLSEDSAQRALKSLEDKGYIKRKTTQRHEVYPYIIHGYEVTVGEHKGKQVNILRTTNIDKPCYEYLAAGESAAGAPDDTTGDSAVQDAVEAADKTRSKNQEVRIKNEELNELMNESNLALMDERSKAKSGGEQGKPESNSSIWVKTDEVNLRLDFVKHFSSCLGKEVSAAAEPTLRELYDESGLTEIQFAGFLFWALDENDYTSRYHRIADDPVATFSKNFAKNLNRYKVETDLVRKGRPSAEWKTDPKSTLRRFNLFCYPPFSADFIERLEDSEAYRVLNWWAEVNARGEMYMYLEGPEPEPGEDSCIIIAYACDLVGPYSSMRTAFFELTGEDGEEYSVRNELWTEVFPESDSMTSDDVSTVGAEDDFTTFDNTGEGGEALAMASDASASGSDTATNDTDAYRCTQYLHELLENDSKYDSCAKGWPEIMSFLLKETHFGEKEFKSFLHWAVKENSSDDPRYSSVDYLHAANDPAMTLKKYAVILAKVFEARKKAKKIKDDIDAPDWLVRDKQMAEAMLSQQREGKITAKEKLAKKAAAKAAEGAGRQGKADGEIVLTMPETPDWQKRDKIMLDNIIAEQRKDSLTGDELIAEMERTGLTMDEVLDQHRAKLAARRMEGEGGTNV